MIEAGGRVIQILMTNGGQRATRSALDAWVNRFDLRITALIDPAGVGTRTLNTYGVRESAFIVDLSTMRVVRRINGSVAGIGPSAIQQIVPTILELLRRGP
ncbi:MAG: hypothetical protein R3A48_15455 [Polyangiales bacterium]